MSVSQSAASLIAANARTVHRTPLSFSHFLHFERYQSASGVSVLAAVLSLRPSHHINKQTYSYTSLAVLFLFVLSTPHPHSFGTSPHPFLCKPSPSSFALFRYAMAVLGVKLCKLLFAVCSLTVMMATGATATGDPLYSQRKSHITPIVTVRNKTSTAATVLPSTVTATTVVIVAPSAPSANFSSHVAASSPAAAVSSSTSWKPMETVTSSDSPETCTCGGNPGINSKKTTTIFLTPVPVHPTSSSGEEKTTTVFPVPPSLTDKTLTTTITFISSDDKSWTKTLTLTPLPEQPSFGKSKTVPATPTSAPPAPTTSGPSDQDPSNTATSLQSHWSSCHSNSTSTSAAVTPSSTSTAYSSESASSSMLLPSDNGTSTYYPPSLTAPLPSGTGTETFTIITPSASKTTNVTVSAMPSHTGDPMFTNGADKSQIGLAGGVVLAFMAVWGF